MSGQEEAPSIKTLAGQPLTVDRVVAFSDGVLAIAGTLLAFNIKAPAQLDVSFWLLLGQIWPQVQSYIISFVVVGIYWNSHHRLFSILERVDGTLIWLNLLFLALICLLPFATSLIGGDRPASATVSFYALIVALIGYSHSALWFKAMQSPSLLIKSGLDLESRVRYGVRLLTPTYFLLSIWTAQYNPVLATISWFGLSILLPVTRLIMRRILTRKT